VQGSAFTLPPRIAFALPPREKPTGRALGYSNELAIPLLPAQSICYGSPSHPSRCSCALIMHGLYKRSLAETTIMEFPRRLKIHSITHTRYGIVELCHAIHHHHHHSRHSLINYLTLISNTQRNRITSFISYSSSSFFIIDKRSPSSCSSSASCLAFSSICCAMSVTLWKSTSATSSHLFTSPEKVSKNVTRP
jgi:hypothetical protein